MNNQEIALQNLKEIVSKVQDIHYLLDYKRNLEDVQEKLDSIDSRMEQMVELLQIIADKIE